MIQYDDDDKLMRINFSFIIANVIPHGMKIAERIKDKIKKGAQQTYRMIIHSHKECEKRKQKMTSIRWIALDLQLRADMR